ncbi:tryptophan-rich sensory protein [Patescibacteria group bacterium]|nr:tryptophan-rich sensory protein [Patescibacteria group bacterium]
MLIKIPQLILSIGFCLGAGVLGSFFTTSSVSTWYATLNKPFFSPPNWIFGPVWITLYIVMGIALYLVQISKCKFQSEKIKAVKIFATQLVLNVSWSIIFFGFQNPTLAFVDILPLWVTIFLTIKAFAKINKLAGNLLIPYLLWVAFAAILNLSIVFLNP